MPPRRRPRPDDQRDQDDGAGPSESRSSARLSEEVKATTSSPEDFTTARSKSKSVEEEEIEETEDDEEEEVEDAISLCNFRYHLGTNYRVDTIRTTGHTMRLFHPSKYEDVVRVLAKWYPGEQLTEETRSDEPSTSGASDSMGGLPSTPLATPVKQEPTPGSSTSKTAPSPPRKRKSKLESVYLEAELIGGDKHNQAIGVGHLTVIAYAPKDIAQRLNAEYRARKGPGSKAISPDTVLNLGYLDISCLRDKEHPLRQFSPCLINQGWIIPRNAYITLQRPFFSDRLVSRHFDPRHSLEGAYFLQYRLLTSDKAWQLMATLSVDFVLPTKMLDYGRKPEEGGSVAKARSGVGRLKRFIASVLNSSPTDVQDGCCSHIEIDRSWPTEDWWRPRRDGKAIPLYYTLPKRQVSLPMRTVSELRPPIKNKRWKAQEAILEQPQPAKSGRKSVEEVLPTDPFELEHYLPLSTNINSLMRACRPFENVPAVEPPKDVVATPLYKFQQQALAWMILRETSPDEDVGTPMPNWLRIKTRDIEVCSCIAQHSVAMAKIETSIEEAPPKTKKARRGAKRSASKQSKQPTRTSEQKAPKEARIAEERSNRHFYIDLVTGTPTQVEFCFSSPREPGGILADELGLGKTLEILSLIAAHQRPDDFKDNSLSARMIAEKDPEDRPFTSTATLVIAPKALLPQWIQECQRHLPVSPILLYEPTWREGDPPEVTVAEMKRKLEGVLIVFVSYEDLSRDYSRSITSARQNNKLTRSISPLLEVFWWRIVADESQLFAGKAAHSPLAKMCHSLWRANSWLCSSTPLSQPKDLSAICTYLDLEPFKNRAAFAELIEAAFYRGDAESVRHLRGLCAKIMWRHERADVEDQIILPTHTELEIKVKAVGLEQSIRERQYNKTRDTICRALVNGRRLSDPDLVMNLRKLISHPSIAPDLGFSNIASFETIFKRFARRTKDQINTCKIMYAVQALVSNAMRQAYLDTDMDTLSWGDNADWLEDGQPFSKDGVDMWLLQAAKFCEDAVGSESDTFLDGEALSTDTQRQTALRFPEALYWIKSALGEPTSPIDYLDPDRVTNLTFRKKIVQAKDVPVKKQRYYFPVARDVGTVEDPAWLERIVGTGQEMQEAARRAIRNQGEGTEPVFVNRLRGGKDGTRAEEQMWTWVPRRTFAAVHSKVLSLQVQLKKLSAEIKWTRTRLEDVQRSKGRTKGEEDESDEDEASDDPDDGADCPICLEEPVIAGILPCLHTACYPCLVEMSRKNTNECPTCRRPYKGVGDITQAVKGKDSDNTDLSALDYGSKINRIASEIQSRLADDPTTKVVIFSLFSKMLNRVFQSLAVIGLQCAVFAGPSTAQQEALANFKDEAGPPVLLCPMKMSEGAAGLTLNFANVAIIVEPALNEALMRQAIGRINRIGQTRPTTTLKMVAEDTIEERIVELAQRRAASETPVANAEADTLTREELTWLFDINVERERGAPWEQPEDHDDGEDLDVRGMEAGVPALDMDDPFQEGDDDDDHILVDGHFDALALDRIAGEDDGSDEEDDDEEDDEEDDEGLDDGIGAGPVDGIGAVPLDRIGAAIDAEIGAGLEHLIGAGPDDGIGAGPNDYFNRGAG